MLERADVVMQSPGSATAGQITGCFSRSSPWFRKLLGGAVIHMPVLVPARGRSRMRANYCSRRSSWRHRSPSGHGQPLCSGEPQPESFRWRWIRDPRDAEAALPPPNAGIRPSPSPLSSTSKLKLPRGTWLAVCWQTPHPFQLCAVQFPSQGGEPGGNATKASGVVLHSLERAGGDAKPGLHASSGPPTPVPHWLYLCLNLWRPFPNWQGVFTINEGRGQMCPLLFKAKHRTLNRPLLPAAESLLWNPVPSCQPESQTTQP